VVAIGAGGALGRALEEVGERLAVVEEDGEAGPGPAEQSLEERLGGEGDIERRSLVPRIGQGVDEGTPWDIGGLPIDRLSEATIVEDAHAEVDPTPREESKAPEGLGIEELVGDEDGARWDVERVAETAYLQGSEALGDIGEYGGSRLGPELDEDMVASVAKDAGGSLRD
jgi:hypothetical protein